MTLIDSDWLFRAFAHGLEVGGEGGLWFDRHDPPVVLPDLLEEGREQAVALGWGLLAIPKAREVGEHLLGLRELRVGRGR
jgi:hypothetical protein